MILGTELIFYRKSDICHGDKILANHGPSPTGLAAPCMLRDFNEKPLSSWLVWAVFLGLQRR